MEIAAVCFDLDGTLVDSEDVYASVRRAFSLENGGAWNDRAQADMMGMSSFQWAQYMHRTLGVRLEPDRIRDEVNRLVASALTQSLPEIPGARDAVKQSSSRWTLALASSSSHSVIDAVLRASGLLQYFKVVVSSDDVESGKPSPAIYLEAAARLGAPAPRCVVVEDSTNGIISGHAAGMTVVAIPNRQYPPDSKAISSATDVLPDIGGLFQCLLRLQLEGSTRI